MSHLNILTSKTPILGQKLYVIIAIAVALITAVIILIIIFYIKKFKANKRRIILQEKNSSIKLESIQINDDKKIEKTLLSMFELDNDDDDINKPIIKSAYTTSNESGLGLGSGTGTSSGSVSVDSLSGSYGWGRWFSLSEIELATGGFAKENVIGEGGYGVVYRGGLLDGTTVVVKNLIDNRD